MQEDYRDDWCTGVCQPILSFILSYQGFFFTVLHFTVEEAYAIEGTLKQMRIAIHLQTKKNKCRIGDIVTYWFSDTQFQ